MKKVLYIYLFSVLSISSFGQKIRFSDRTNVWKELELADWPITYLDYQCNYIGDTISNGIKYEIFSGARGLPSGLCLIREDSILSKVYVKILPNFGGSSIDTTEQVLYDYNWQVGDTVIRNLNGYFIHVISGVDSTLINSVWHKVWHFQAVNSGSKNFDIIEGIGCTDNPIFPLSPMNFENAFRLMCFRNFSGSPTVNPAISGYFDNKTSCTLGIDQIAEKSKNVLVIPNPINKSGKIVFPYTISTGSVILSNVIGQIVINIPIQNKEEIAIGDKIEVSCLYFYRVVDIQSGKVFSGKFMVQ